MITMRLNAGSGTAYCAAVFFFLFSCLAYSGELADLLGEAEDVVEEKGQLSAQKLKSAQTSAQKADLERSRRIGNKVKEAIQEGREHNEADRARLGVTEQLGIYKIETEDDNTYVYCNRAPTLANKMVRQANGLCYEPPAIGAYDCLEVLETLKNRCG